MRWAIMYVAVMYTGNQTNLHVQFLNEQRSYIDFISLALEANSLYLLYNKSVTEFQLLTQTGNRHCFLYGHGIYTRSNLH